MSSSDSSHRKSRSSSFFRRSSLVSVLSSNADKLSSSSSSPLKGPPCSRTRLSASVVLPPEGLDGRSDDQHSVLSYSTGDFSKYSTTDSASSSPTTPHSPLGIRPGLPRRAVRPSSIFGSLKTLRFSEDDVSSGASPDMNYRRTSSFMGRDWGLKDEYIDIGKNRTILQHGEVQTNTGSWRRKREYFVLTETHLVRFKSQSKAAETFYSLPPGHSRNSIIQHSSSPSVDSERDGQFYSSDMAGERATAIPLEQLVAVIHSDEGRQLFTLELSYLDKELNQGCSVTMQLHDAQSSNAWLQSLRQAANKARLHDVNPIPQRLSEYAAFAVEREKDYDINQYKIYKVAKRVPGRNATRSSTDESVKTSATICFLVIGAHKVHLIAVPKSLLRQSSPALTDLGDCSSFGILNLTWISVNGIDDSFSLAFRSPFQRAKPLQLASLAASEIALQLRRLDAYLRPEWFQRPFAFNVPSVVENAYVREDNPHGEDHDCFDRTLTAFCVAYGVNASAIRYSINYSVEDSPRFELLHPGTPHSNCYSALELLAIFRSLRFNESFTSLSFAHIDLDILNRMRDPYGLGNVCTASKYGSPTHPTIDMQQDSSLLVQEIRALAIGNKRLRRLDFSGCMTVNPSSNANPLSCGIIEALYPLCKEQATNVDWLLLNGIRLTGQDFAWLINFVSEKDSHLRAVEVSGCELSNEETSLLLDVLGAQKNTLEAQDVSGNRLRLSSLTLAHQLKRFDFIRKLDFSNLSIDSSSEALLPLKLLCCWRLESLRLQGIKLNRLTVEALEGYLAHPQSQIMQELNLSKCALDGANIADLLHSMTQEPHTARYLHLDISDNQLLRGYEQLVAAIGRGLAPTHLSLRSIEYEQEDMYRKILVAFATNRSIRYLDISKASLPSEASEGTIQALSRLFSENKTIAELDISGECTRLEVSRIGVGINVALRGLEQNSTLQILRIQDQRLGLSGASSLASVLKVNTTLRELHCESNGITLSGFTDLVNALVTNTTLQYLPYLEEGKDAALRQTEQQIKEARVKAHSTLLSASNPMSSSSTTMLTMRRTFTRASGAKAERSRNSSSDKVLSLMATRRNIATIQGVRNDSTDRLLRMSSSNMTLTIGAVPDWTDSDVQAALRLVSEGWEGEVQRLKVFLNRNRLIAGGYTIDDATMLSRGKELGQEIHASNDITTTTNNTTPWQAESRGFSPQSDFPTLTIPIVQPVGQEKPQCENNNDNDSVHIDIKVDRTPLFEEDDFNFGHIGLHDSPSTPRGKQGIQCGGEGLGIHLVVNADCHVTVGAVLNTVHGDEIDGHENKDIDEDGGNESPLEMVINHRKKVVEKGA